jgi:hypothetical protein
MNFHFHFHALELNFYVLGGRGVFLPLSAELRVVLVTLQELPRKLQVNARESVMGD